jgi:hypothetical protein
MSERSDDDSLSSFQADFDRLAGMLQLFSDEIDSLGTNLQRMQKPLEDIELSQLMDVRTLEASTFRRKTFQMKLALAGIDGAKRVPFHQICSYLRTYLFQHNMVLPDGTLQLDTTLKLLFSVEEPVTFLDLIARLHRIVV